MSFEAAIAAIDSCLPERVVDNAELATAFPDWDGAKFEQKVGIRRRHIADPGQTALDLAVDAGRRVLASRDSNQVDFVLLCTQSPDYFLPTSACLLQRRLGLKTGIGALDFNLGCSGFVYGLALAKGLVAAGVAENVLLVTAETYSKHIHPDDRANRAIFGDGAAAAIISRSAKPGIGQFVLGTDGEGGDHLIVRAGAMRSPGVRGTTCSDGGPEPQGAFGPEWFYMNGPELFNFTINTIPGMIHRVLEKNGLSLGQVDYFIFHQANRYLLEHLRKKIGIPVEKFCMNMQMKGNTVSATIPIALQESLDQGIVSTGNRVLLAGFGVGYSWAATVVTI